MKSTKENLPSKYVGKNGAVIELIPVFYNRKGRKVNRPRWNIKFHQTAKTFGTFSDRLDAVIFAANQYNMSAQKMNWQILE